MTKTFNVLNEHVFVFLAVVILGAIVISVLLIIAPEKSVKFNFNPFPKIAPTSLPDPNHPTDGCWNKLTPCTPGSDNECSACSLGEYECVTVETDGHRHFNGINVPKGNWCLPKDKNPAGKVCNEYTGRYLWVFDPAYCNEITPGNNQCWKCECLYPNLFADPSTGCTSRLACQNDSVSSHTLTQPENTLTATKCSPSSIQSCEWDPTKEQAKCDTSSLYQYTPYDQDENGNPWFSCSCPSTAGGQFFSELPGDPFTCHLDPCYSSLSYNSRGIDNCTRDCVVPGTCTCNCDSTNVAKSPGGDFEGTCTLISNSCGHFGYDKDKQECTCPSPFWPQECRNPNTGVNMDKPELPVCLQEENALGSQCINPCEGGPDEPTCENGSLCVSCGPDTWAQDPVCDVDQWIPDTAKSEKECTELCKKYQCAGTKFDASRNVCFLNIQNHNRTHAQCDCSSVKKVPGKPFAGWSGSTCAVACLGDGTRIKSHLLWNDCHCFNCACCCSGRKRTHNDFWNVAYDVMCDGDYGFDKPPESDCVPAEDCPLGKDTDCVEWIGC
uniref:Uncharacterized protein n=1 Tax=viral metagenome TaxID=1070528 RepID=A0A6C0EJT5_9ZZZZ